MNAVAEVLDLGILTSRDKLLMQRKISDCGLGLCSMEANLEFMFLAGFIKILKSINTRAESHRGTKCSLCSSHL